MGVAVRTVSLENEEARFISLLRQVEESYTSAAQDQSDFSKLHENIMQLEKHLFSLEADDARARTVLEGLASNAMSSVHDAYCLWETGLERQFAVNLANGNAALTDYPLYERFDELVRRELSLVSAVPPQRVLFIGSGAFPISAIHLHFQTGAPVDCIGHLPDDVVLSRQALEKCGAGGPVRVFDDNEESYELEDYDLILIALRARPKKSILKNLRKRCRLGCRILCRTSTGLRQLIYEPTAARDLRGFHIRGEQRAEGPQTISTWLLETAGSAVSGIRLEWLRGIDADQAVQLLRLMNRTLEEETTIGFPGPLDEETGYGLMRQLDADLQAGRRHVLIAEKDGVIVGQLILTPNSTPNHRHMVELTRGTIDPSFRGGGLALLAFQEVARKCDELGRELICLDVRAGTLAAMWWQHFGFKPWGLLSDYSRVGENRYQGLYLSQSTADLKRRVREIARDAQKAPASSFNQPN
jgi:GNAT superfamily N-acetyltransferase